jgi:hypothetical protein
MPVAATVLFDAPQREIASLLRQKLSSSIHTQIVAGFITVEGVAALEAAVSANAPSVDTIVVGAGTYRAYQAFDRLIVGGVKPTALFVHLGHTRQTGANAKHRFYRYHPMLHSKVYYMEYRDGSASAVIGSHNVTGFALQGLNGEAAVLLEGPKSSPEFEKIRQHIAAASAEALNYTPGMKDAFSWWTHQFIEGLADKANDAPREGEAKRTIVIMAQYAGTRLPKADELLYFELRSALGTVTNLKAEVHMFLFDTLPATPTAALAMLDQARASYWCRAVGLEMRKGGVELLADWYLDDDRRPELKPTKKPFRPKPSPDMQQVRVQIYNKVHGEFEYLFDTPSAGWIPLLDQRHTVELSRDVQGQFESLELIPPEHLPWHLVTGLVRAEPNSDSAYLSALEEMSPSAGSYILMSLRRKERDRT